jgi:2-amino-4-hydroxy-6-hydroxymethyldihydropteridine diphosphokinase
MVMKGLATRAVWVLLGGNLGQREHYVRAALDALVERGLAVEAVSGLYETAPWGNTQQPSFLNAAARLKTSFPLMKVLDVLLEVEQSLGRERDVPWGPRTIDLDLLMAGAEVVHHNRLQVPHPHLAQRRFALLPLAELNPELVHPLLGLTVSELLINCKDSSGVEIFRSSGWW